MTDQEREAALGGLAAYAKFLEVRNEVMAAGGRNPEPFRSVTAGEALLTYQSEAADLVQAGGRTVGLVQARNVSVKSVSLKKDPTKHIVPEVVASSCEDASQVDVLDSAGNSVRLPGAPLYFSTKIWVSYLSKNSDHDEGWIVINIENKGASSC